MTIQSINPYNDELIQSFDELTDDQIKDKLDKAQKAYESWKKISFEERASLFLKLAEIYKSQSAELGRLASIEMGKPIKGAIAEVEKSTTGMEYYANNAAKFLSEEYIQSDASESYVRFDPLGIILAVMPWNFPYWQVIRFAAPALMAGNVGVLKHASNVPQSALAIERTFLEAGFPEGVFQTLLIGSSKVEGILRDPRVKGVALTGSEKAGASVASIAGSEIKRSVLELGGSDPYIVLDDADIDLACSIAVNARFQNNGQSCIAAKRFIVVESKYDEFVARITEGVKALKVGDQLDEATQIGPVVNKESMEELLDQVKRSLDMGATLVYGGERVGDKGSLMLPTLLTNVTEDMPVFKEETFGPVMPIIKAKDNEEALRIANNTTFGLGASIWTQDIEKAKEFAKAIHSGAVFINGMVKSDARLPFGGNLRSGFGRELSHYGIKEFVNIKTVWIK